jgi:hypothetical protein
MEKLYGGSKNWNRWLDNEHKEMIINKLKKEHVSLQREIQKATPNVLIIQNIILGNV